MANTIAYAEIFQKALDEVLAAGALTGWMAENAAGVIYNGGKTYKVPKISFDSTKPKDYDRTEGFTKGSVTLEYEEKTFDKDWGESYVIDSMDVDETNFAATATNVMNERQRGTLIPAIDAYRLNKIEKLAAGKSHSRTLTPTKANVYSEIKADLASAIAETGLDESDCVIHISATAYDMLTNSTELQKTLMVNGAAADLNTKVKTLNGATLIRTPDSRMQTDDNKLIYWEVMARIAPVAIVKNDKVRIFAPDVNQMADGYKIDQRIYHTLNINDNKLASVYCAKAAE